MKKLFFMFLAILATAGSVNADLVIDDFESYADDAALQAAWPIGGYIYSSSLENQLNGQCMFLETDANSPYWEGSAAHQLPGTVPSSYGLNFSGYDTMKMTFAVPPEAADVKIRLSLYDCWNTLAMQATYYNYLIPAGTGWPDGIVWQIDLASYTVSGMNLENIQTVRLDLLEAWDGDSAVYIDDIILTPEPATIVLLGLGSIALIRKKTK